MDMKFIDQLYSFMSKEGVILISLSIMLLSGFLITRITKFFKLPNVSGYIIAGVIIGPNILKLVPQNVLSNMSFISDIALSFIAFGVGSFFRKEIIRKTGTKVIVITILEALLSGILITLFIHFVFKLSWNFCLVLGAIATATAPASTTMTIKQYNAKGDFVDILLQVVALDDVVCLLAFSIVIAFVNLSHSKNVNILSLLLPIIFNIIVLILGVILGILLKKLLNPKRSDENRLIIVITMLLGLSGICSALSVSPLLACMVFGATYINITYDVELYEQLDHFTPPILSLFFIVSGMNLDISVMKTVGMIGVSYFIIRIIGKYLGTYLGCLFTKTNKKIKNYLGLAMIPQAGVAIGLAFLGQRLLPPETGNLLLTIILSSSVLYELVGPASAKASLILSGSISIDKNEKSKLLVKENYS